MLAVLDRHLLRTVKTVQDVCAANHFQPIEVMLEELVNRFTDAKLADRDTSVALYRIAADTGGSLIVNRTRKRYEVAISAMLQTAGLPVSADVNFMVQMIYMTMAGTLRGHLESNAPLRSTGKLREHLAKMVVAYCRTM